MIEASGAVLACGGWSDRRKLFTGSPGQEALVGERVLPGEEPARIRAFFVDPEHSQRGLGRQLYFACEEAARSAGFAWFTLMATLPGVPFYERLGFQKEDPTDIDLPDGTILPCVVMSKKIEGT